VAVTRASQLSAAAGRILQTAGTLLPCCLLRTFNQIDRSTTISRLADKSPAEHKKCFKDELQQAAQSWFVTLRISDWESPPIRRLPRVEV